MKLTNHIAIHYIGVTIAVLLMATPITYFVLRAVMINSIDESIEFQREWIEKKLGNASPITFTSFDENITIRPTEDTTLYERHYTEDIYVAQDKEMVPYRIMEFNTTTNGTSYFIRIQRSLVENEDLLQAILVMQIFILILLFLALLFINRRLNKKIWIPFYKTLNALSLFRIDRDGPLNLPKSSITELNNLNQSLNTLTSHNARIFKAQKEFTENASHELQMPLAIMQSKLDLLWQTDSLNQEQVNLLEEMSETSSRMRKLNKSLLLLAKIDNNQFAEKREINVPETTRHILTQHEETFSERNIHVVTLQKASSTVIADEILTVTLITNLITNALRYTPKDGTLEVQILLNAIRVGNTAVENQPLDRSKLFKRFQKQSHCNSSGTGLGLEICRRICELNNWQIRYEFLEGKHWFVVEF
ncbi:MAG TPA: HAMP domain-containing sensor histidine kinase [Paludibacteraceae bacterium]|nr:HAMP domain-containing sensor histidine kinase [Bacteroidaceae bacterium]HNX88846.1 HAMP domain-containing sensor histidine kinase [Paludibacteraceae bacterium]